METLPFKKDQNRSSLDDVGGVRDCHILTGREDVLLRNCEAGGICNEEPAIPGQRGGQVYVNGLIPAVVTDIDGCDRVGCDGPIRAKCQEVLVWIGEIGAVDFRMSHRRHKECVKKEKDP